MKTATILAVTLCATATAYADFSYTTTRKSQGSPAAGAAPSATKYYFKGQRMATDSGDTATVAAVAQLPPGAVPAFLGVVLILAVLIEALTAALRFGLHLESTRDTANTIGTLTLGLRVHHGYIGVFLMLLGWCFPRGIRHAVWIVGIGLIVSDLMHHFLVLWPITGSPQFDLVYPNHQYWKAD